MTELSKIYDKFLSKISDYTFLESGVTDEDIYSELRGYLTSATAKFYKCKKSLEIVKDLDSNDCIEGDLNSYEIELIAKLMLVEYMTPMMLSSEVLKQGLSDKDFRIYSQANQLRELNLVYRLLQKEANKMITEYTFIGMVDKDD